ncbi:MAG: Co2+/Mg2+ efflux protein ApaG [Thalassotalea sp.]
MIEFVDTIDISVKSNYLSEHSIEDEQYVFSYTITIENQGLTQMQLISRSWLITDANGDITTVEGDGVVGQQPHLAPTLSYTYSSGCALKTPVGTMQGYYVFQAASGEKVKATIPVFTLATPNILN